MSLAFCHGSREVPWSLARTSSGVLCLAGQAQYGALEPPHAICRTSFPNPPPQSAMSEPAPSYYDRIAAEVTAIANRDLEIELAFGFIGSLERCWRSCFWAGTRTRRTASDRGYRDGDG